MGVFDSGDVSCNFTHGFYLDTASSMALELDTCDVRFLPAHMADGVDKDIRAPKVLFSITQNDPDVTLSSDTCAGARACSFAVADRLFPCVPPCAGAVVG